MCLRLLSKFLYLPSCRENIKFYFVVTFPWLPRVGLFTPAEKSCTEKLCKLNNKKDVWTAPSSRHVKLFSVIISCILFKWILIIYLYEWKHVHYWRLLIISACPGHITRLHHSIRTAYRRRSAIYCIKDRKQEQVIQKILSRLLVLTFWITRTKLLWLVVILHKYKTICIRLTGIYLLNNL